VCIDSRRGIDVVRPPNDEFSPADCNTPHEWTLDEFAHSRTHPHTYYTVLVIVVIAEIRSHPVPTRPRMPIPPPPRLPMYTARALRTTYTLAGRRAHLSSITIVNDHLLRARAAAAVDSHHHIIMTSRGSAIRIHR